MNGRIPDLETYHVSPVYGFLLDTPLTSLPEYFSPWADIANNIATLLEEKTLRKKIYELPLLDHTKLLGYRQMRLAYLYLTFISNGYVWQDGDKGVTKILPRQLAIPLCAIAQFLGTKSILNHVSFCLSNWRKIDPDGPMHYKNLDTIVHYPGGDSFRFFTVVTTQVELEAVPGIKACVDALHAVVKRDKKAAIKALQVMQTSVEKMKEALGCMNKEVTPEIFFNKIRPYLSGWGGPSSVLPDGLVYDGVSDQPHEGALMRPQLTRLPVTGCHTYRCSNYYNKASQCYVAFLMECHSSRICTQPTLQRTILVYCYCLDNLLSSKLNQPDIPVKLVIVLI